jgi:hypothetical protein
VILGRVVGQFVVAVVVATAFGGAQAQARGGQDDWASLGKLLSVIQVLMSVSSASQDDPKAAQRTLDDLMSGRNAEANALAAEIFADVPPAERERLLGIARSMVAMGQKQVVTEARTAGEAAAIQARKDLTAIGLTYYDRGQFLDAVRRGDLVAVRLYLVGRGVDPAAKDLLGNTALDLARRSGNPERIALLSAAGPRQERQQSP